MREVSDESPTARRPVGRAYEMHVSVFVNDEVHFVAGTKTKLLANGDGDGDLPFVRDSHAGKSITFLLLPALRGAGAPAMRRGATFSA